MVRRAFVAIVMAVMGLGWVTARGQTQPDLQNGFRPYGSYHGTNIDTVNLANGNLMLHLPVPQSPEQRGELDLSFQLYTTSKTWIESCTPSPCKWVPFYGSTGISFQRNWLVNVQRRLTVDSESGTPIYQAFNYTVVTGDGASHFLYAIPGTADSSGNPTQFESFDGTGFHVTLSNTDSVTGLPDTAVVIDRAGVQHLGNFSGGQCRTDVNRSLDYSGGGFRSFADNGSSSSMTCTQTTDIATLTDRNGNVLDLPPPAVSGQPSSTGVVTDTLGRNLPTPVFSDSTGCTGTFAQSFWVNFAGPNGVTNGLKLCWTQANLATAFGVTGVAEATAPAQLLSTAVRSDGSKWSFTYDGYSNLTSVTLPTGGSVSYTWGAADLSCTGTPSRVVKTRTLDDGHGNTYTWTYQWGTPSNGSLSNIVTGPDGNDTVHVFTALGTNCKGFYETSTLTYQGSQSSGQLLKRVDTAYSTALNLPRLVANVFATSIQTTIYPSGEVSLVTKTYDTGLGANAPIFGNVVSEKVYDWGQGAPGALLREIDTSYMWQSDARYLNANLLDLPASVVTKDGNGNRMAETDYTYDESQYLTVANITTQHGAAPNSVRGNLTTVSHWLNPGNSTVSSHTNWYDTGEVYQQIDPLGNTTIHSYDPFYVGAYSTKTCNALNQCVSGTYDFATGLLTSFTNANATTQASSNTPGDSAHTANYAYDLLERMTSATMPADPSGNQPQTTFNYPDLTTVERLHKITTSLTDDAFTYSDGLGRTIRSKHIVPGGNALVDTTYDGLDRVSTVTNPYFTTSEMTYGVTQSQYDALGRPTQTTRQDSSITAISYSDNCTTTTDEAGKQRRACTDAIGRLIEVDEPGDNFPGSQAAGSLAINGSLQSKSGIGAVGSTRGSATVTISGSNQFILGDRPPCDPCNPTLYDSGKVFITIKGHEYDYFYGSNGSAPDLASSIAQGLVNVIQADAGRLVNASVPTNGTTITLTAVAAGTIGNYAFSSGSAYDTGDFSQPSFTTSPTSGRLSGGTDSNPGTTVYDSGTITATIGSFNASINYSQSNNSTSAQVASALASALSAGNSPVTAAASGSNISITYKTIGAAGNLALSVNSSTSQSQYFSSPSFTSSGTVLSGGFDPEGPSLDHAYYATLYFYDALGNLLCLEQHGNVAGTGCSSPTSSDSTSPWRVRRFTYDSLSRLLTANNPESGLISYFYDANGNLTQKVMPTPNQTGTATHTVSYCYDALNRVTGKAYSWQNCQSGQLPQATAAVSYRYDQGTNGIGHLTSLTDQAGSASYRYDVLGRMASETRTINGVTKTMSYTYNLDGSLATMTYPSGAVITNTLDSAGRLLSAVDTTSSSNPINYVTGATYNAAGSLTGSIFGQNGSFTGIANTFVYTNRLQPCRMMASTTGAVSPNCDASWGNVLDLRYDFHQGSGNNGNVWAITNYRDQSRNQTFTYDPLNRLVSAQNAGTDCTKMLSDGHTEYWGNSYGYDAWGNLKQKNVTKCQAENLNAAVSSNNQLQGYSYDAAGNMSRDNNGTNYVYDPENRIAGAAGFTYIYDADGNRVEKSNGTSGTLYWYMTAGIVAESDLSGNLQSEYVFFGGERVARRDSPANTVFYYFSDHLKTASVITDATGTIKSESDYYPWGGELQFANGDSNHYKFTGKERDAETGLDYFGARHYSNGLGRFITPDWSAIPVPVPYVDLTDPQSLNQYSYVRNVPTARIDLDGHDGLWDFLRGVGNAWASDNLMGAGRNDQGGAAYHLGQLIGDAGATIQGGAETLLSAGGEAAGGVLDATGVGLPAGVALNTVSTVGLVHGSGTFTTAASHLFRDKVENSGGSGGSSSSSNQSRQGKANSSGQETGSYTNTHASGKTYSGKGSRARSQASGKRVEKHTGDKHTATDWTPSSNDREAFKDESRRIDGSGGPNPSNNYNQRESPGTNYRKQDGSH